MRVVLIEDEVPALDHLAALLRKVAPDARVTAQLRTVRETRAWIAAGAEADLVLADIELGDGLSLDALADSGLTAPVLFTTAFDHYLAPALAGNGVAYLHKPVREADLAQAIEKVRRLERHFLGGLADLARRLRPPHPARIVGRRGLDWVSLATEDLAWVHVRHGGSWAMDRHGAELLLDAPLSALEPTLDPARFLRVNRWFLVALAAIRRVRPEGRGRLLVVVEPEAPVPVVVPQEGAAAFRSWFGL
jgi:DNA-binding LytR/AlgR family response regulator